MRKKSGNKNTKTLLYDSIGERKREKEAGGDRREEKKFSGRRKTNDDDAMLACGENFGFTEIVK